MKKLLAIILMLSLLSIVVVSAEDQTTNLQEIEYKKLLLEQHAKTQAEFKQELAKRDAMLETKVVSMVNENFAQLDKRIDGFIRQATFKLGMAFLSAMVLGGTILMLINNQLSRKRAIKRKLENHNQQSEQMILSGDTLHAIKEQTEVVEERKITPVKSRGRPKKLKDLPTNFPTPTSLSSVPSMKEKTIEPMGDS